MMGTVEVSIEYDSGPEGSYLIGDDHNLHIQRGCCVDKRRGPICRGRDDQSNLGAKHVGNAKRPEHALVCRSYACTRAYLRVSLQDL